MRIPTGCLDGVAILVGPGAGRINQFGRNACASGRFGDIGMIKIHRMVIQHAIRQQCLGAITICNKAALIWLMDNLLCRHAIDPIPANGLAGVFSHPPVLAPTCASVYQN